MPPEPPEYLEALAAEFEAVPAFLLPGPGQEAIPAFVRSFVEHDQVVRLTIETEPGVGPQLVIYGPALRLLVDDPQTD